MVVGVSHASGARARLRASRLERTDVKMRILPQDGADAVERARAHARGSCARSRAGRPQCCAGDGFCDGLEHPRAIGQLWVNASNKYFT